MERELKELSREHELMIDPRLRYFDADTSSASTKKYKDVKSQLTGAYGPILGASCSLKCVFCSCEGTAVVPITLAHIIPGQPKTSISSRGPAGYFEHFNPPRYRTQFNAQTARNFLPLCGTLGCSGTCHDAFDKFYVSLLANPLTRKYHVFVLVNREDPKWKVLHNKEVVLPDSDDCRPYARGLCWRMKKCVKEFASTLDSVEILDLMNLSELNEKNESIAGGDEKEEEAGADEDDLPIDM
jgi:hypothetical protein